MRLRVPKPAALPSPCLTWAGLSGRTRSSFLWCFKTTSFRSCSSAQAVMALSTWARDQHRGKGTAAGRVQGQGKVADRREGGKEMISHEWE